MSSTKKPSQILVTFTLYALALGGTAQKAWAQAQSGSISFSQWTANWSIENSAGISIKNVTWQGTTYIYKASVPTVRVQYNNNVCGPYADRLTWDFIQTASNGEKARLESGSVNNVAFMKLYVYATIVSYKINQGWIFFADGRLLPFVESSGLQCAYDHRHHPYWRIDMDVGGSSNDEFWTNTNGSWSNPQNEGTENKTTNRYWTIWDRTANRQIDIGAGPTDGTADSFATYDWARTRFNGLEAEPWVLSSPFADEGDKVLPFIGSENVFQTDIVGWYIGHLFHNASLGGTQWAYVGPTMQMW